MASPGNTHRRRSPLLAGTRITSGLSALTLFGFLGLLGLLVVFAPSAWIARAARPRTFANPSSVPARSIAIVPGTRGEGGRPQWIVRARLQATLGLYRAGRVGAILVSGNDSAAAPEVTVMRGWLLSAGVPAEAIWSDRGGSRTRETMNRAASLYGVTDAIVCTQAVNMARALYLARAAGIDAVGLALPSELGRSERYLATESLKSTLAFAESFLREGIERPAPLLATR